MHESLAEAQAIFQWIAERERDRKNPVTVLVGGWAVFTYNRYYGSIDIDLVTNSRTRSSLETYLIGTRGYRRRHDPESQVPFVSKDFGRSGTVEVDFGNRGGPNRFEGRSEELPLSLLEDNTVRQPLNELDVPVPTRSLLLLMKMKAAWDRQWRLDQGRSRDIPWEQGKLVKDRSDILALIDPERGGDDLDIGFLGHELAKFRFLDEVLEEVRDSSDAALKYELAHTRAKDIIDRFKGIIY